MKIETEEKDGKLYVTVTIPPHSGRNKRMKVDLPILLEALEKRKIKHGQCLHSVKVTNRNLDGCKGTFIFELSSPKPKTKPKLKPKPKPKPKKTTILTSQKVKKKLDNN